MKGAVTIVRNSSDDLYPVSKSSGPPPKRYIENQSNHCLYSETRTNLTQNNIQFEHGTSKLAHHMSSFRTHFHLYLGYCINDMVSIIETHTQDLESITEETKRQGQEIQRHDQEIKQLKNRLKALEEFLKIDHREFDATPDSPPAK